MNVAQPARRDVQIQRDIVYGTGIVRPVAGRPAHARELKLDLYQPLPTAGDGPRPALVLAFGGAFHRGTKEDDTFGEPPNRNHAIAWYCREFARLGYVACSIDYRLVPENPEPGDTVVVASAAHIPRSRVDAVRGMLGLPPASDDMLWRGVEAACDDMALAVRYVRAHAGAWHIDPGRIAVGGFSAGARTALNVALGERERVAAVVALSGYMHEDDLKRHVAALDRPPAVLGIYAEHDLDYIAGNCPRMIGRMRELGMACEAVRVPGATHFYPAHARALHERDGPTTVWDAMAGFLARTLAA